MSKKFSQTGSILKRWSTFQPRNSLLALLTDVDNSMLMVRPGGKREAVYQAVWADNKDFDQVLISKCMVQVREKYQKIRREKERWVGEGEGEGERAEGNGKGRGRGRGRGQRGGERRREREMEERDGEWAEGKGNGREGGEKSGGRERWRARGWREREMEEREGERAEGGRGGGREGGVRGRGCREDERRREREMEYRRGKFVKTLVLYGFLHLSFHFLQKVEFTLQYCKVSGQFVTESAS